MVRARLSQSLSLLLALLVLAVPAAAPRAAEAPRPNLLFFLCDDLGYGDLGCFGSELIRTPNLDRLASEGAKLTACYSGSPVCSPSRASIMTGRNPNRLGIRDWIPPNSGIFLKTEEVTVAELLKQAGYKTAHIGKWHLNSRFNGREPTPGDHGFDYWMSTQNNAAPTHQNPTNFVRNRMRVGPLTGNSTTIIAEEAMRWIEGVGKGPWAVFVWFHAPHEKVEVPEDFLKAEYPDDPDTDRAHYRASVTLVDREVGRMLKQLETLGLRERTWVQFTSDNGPETLKRYPNATRSHGSPGPFRGMKLHVTEGGYRVPGIIRWPGHIRPGTVVAEPIAGYDILPTFCELAGVAPPADRPLDGTSFLPALEGRPVVRKVPLYWQYDLAISTPWTLALRDGDWKLLSDAKLEKFELHNLRTDPGEKADLSTSEPERLQRMAAALRKAHADVNR